MTLAADLKAAKALIDTPAKFASIQFGVLGAVSDVMPEEEGVTLHDERYEAARAAIIAQSGTTHLVGINHLPHAEIMSMLDRAIVAAEATP